MRLSTFVFVVASTACAACGSGSQSSSASDGGGGVDAAGGGDSDAASDSSAGSDSGMDGGAGNSGTAGTGTGTIIVTASIRWVVSASAGNVIITVLDSSKSDANVTDATVTLTPAGQAPMTLPYAPPFAATSYGVTLTSYYATYDLSITAPEGTRTGVHIIAPSVHTVTIPTSTLGNPVTVHWTPFGEDVTAAVSVDGSATPQYDGPDIADTGSTTVDASNFPSAGPYTVYLSRIALTHSVPPDQGFAGGMTVVAQTMITL